MVELAQTIYLPYLTTAAALRIYLSTLQEASTELEPSTLRGNPSRLPLKAGVAKYHNCTIVGFRFAGFSFRLP